MIPRTGQHIVYGGGECLIIEVKSLGRSKLVNKYGRNCQEDFEIAFIYKGITYLTKVNDLFYPVGYKIPENCPSWMFLWKPMEI